MGWEMATGTVPAARRARSRRMGWVAPLLLALGPSVIGLCADNDAGGMLSYLVSGASHGLSWLLPALLFLGLPTVFVMWVAMRVAEATGLPYSRVLTARVGAPLARLEAIALYGLNGVILVTEFVGMTLALSLAGLPRPLSVALTFGLVVVLTNAGTYARIEQLLLRVALGNLVFVPALLFVHHPSGALLAAFTAHVPDRWFLLLALAGNTLAPWMVYWQQNAVCAGDRRTSGQRMADLVAGQVAMVVMACTVLLLGALTPGAVAAGGSPVAWVFHAGGRTAGILFAVGLFDAGLLAACTISLASLWMLREATGGAQGVPVATSNQGGWRILHVGTLAVAAGVVLWPHLSAGALALWAQAVGGLWLPVTLVLLGLVASSRRIMGHMAIGPAARVGLVLMAAGYLVLACLGILAV